MGRLSRALLVAVVLWPAHSGAQTSSLPSTSSIDLFRAGSNTYASRYDRLPLPSRYFVPGSYSLGGSSDADDPSPVMSRYMAMRTSDRGRRYEPGRLRLDVVPSTARVYVDGSFIGTVGDVNYRSGGYALSPGAHRVAVRAAGYDSAGSSVWVAPGQSVPYQDYLDHSLSSIRYRPSFVPVSYSRRPAWRYVRYVEPPVQTRPGLYVIPGCYAGDAPPRPEKLLPGCKLENLRRVYH
jgi:hypothetical protein